MQLLRGDVRVIGHRGAAALAPENSLEAIEAAAVHGADAVELDVVRDESGSLVLAHSVDAPAGAPALDDALELASSLGLAVQLDLKPPGLEREVAAALRRHGLDGRSFVSSCSLSILAACAAADESLPRAFTYPEDRHGVTGRPLLSPIVPPALALLRALLPFRLPRLLRQARASAATLNAGVVSGRVIEACHTAGVAVCAWTVNDAAAARTLVEAGADAIITDDPRIFAGGITRA